MWMNYRDVELKTASKTVTKPDRRLRLMRIPIGAKVRGYVKGRTVEDKTPVLGSDEDSFRHTEVGAGSIEESDPAL